jgi:uncharacterized LabA/DUF88 family protein
VLVEPFEKRAVAFVDGQNLFHRARRAFGCAFPNYDPLALATTVCGARGWDLREVRFYTGVPDPAHDAPWSRFWTGKTATMGRQGVVVFTRRLKYRTQRVALPDGGRQRVLVAEEKGIDVRIAVDIIRLAHRRAYDVGLLFSQDQDFSEVAREIRTIAREQDRWIKLACAFPVGPGNGNQRGVDHTDWIGIDRSLYERCVDPRDYRLPS